MARASRLSGAGFWFRQAYGARHPHLRFSGWRVPCPPDWIDTCNSSCQAQQTACPRWLPRTASKGFPPSPGFHPPAVPPLPPYAALCWLAQFRSHAWREYGSPWKRSYFRIRGPQALLSLWNLFHLDDTGYSTSVLYRIHPTGLPSERLRLRNASFLSWLLPLCPSNRLSPHHSPHARTNKIEIDRNQQKN